MVRFLRWFFGLLPKVTLSRVPVTLVVALIIALMALWFGRSNGAEVATAVVAGWMVLTFFAWYFQQKNYPSDPYAPQPSRTQTAAPAVPKEDDGVLV